MPDAKRKEAGKLRVLVVGTSRLMTSAWSAAIGSSSTIETVGEVTSPEEALALVPHSDVVLFCALTQVEAGVEWVRVITRAFPESRILAVGIPNLEHVILGYVEAGACAYLSDEETIDCVLESLSGAVHGQAYVAPEVAPALIARLARLRQAYVEPESLGSRLGALTPREREILELIAQNLGNRQIADRLLIEIGTVKNHVHSILDKLSMESRHQVAAHLIGRKGIWGEMELDPLVSSRPVLQETGNPAPAGKSDGHERRRDEFLLAPSPRSREDV
jgi:two-component system response regulator DegU